MSVIPKIITPSKQVVNSDWNNHLITPLVIGEKVILHSDQTGVGEGFVRVKHGPNKVVSIFSISDFVTLKGEKIC